MLLRLTVSIIVFLSACVYANAEVYEFETEAQRNSYLSLSSELRCPKCQNQNLSDSNSEIADIMREVIAEEVAKGESEDSIKSMMVDRYGEFVLYKPPVNNETMALWWAPVVFLGIIVVVFILIIARRSKNIDLDDDDE